MPAIDSSLSEISMQFIIALTNIFLVTTFWIFTLWIDTIINICICPNTKLAFNLSTLRYPIYVLFTLSYWFFSPNYNMKPQDWKMLDPIGKLIILPYYHIQRIESLNTFLQSIVLILFKSSTIWRNVRHPGLQGSFSSTLLNPNNWDFLYFSL